MSTEQKKQAPDKARNNVILNLILNDALKGMLPKERMAIFKSQPFREWPKEMQEALEPYGAKMIE